MCSTRVRIVIAPSSARGSVCGAVEHPWPFLPILKGLFQKLALTFVDTAGKI